ncbi:MAG TPA: serine hydrolase domain-containing protein [Bryobacteraceae bacterium]|nr:serine hydrolase domain-containing protein [Bryobacteraceae bacterium]
MQENVTFAIGQAVKQLQIPSAVAIAADKNRVLYSAAFGETAADTIFAIASMTKAITTVAVLQLVERGLLDLDAPVDRHLPALRNLPVLEGFGADGDPRFSAPAYSVTARQLLSHTAGFSYPWNHPLAERYGRIDPPFLVHKPGTQWQYGINVDWAGRLVEAVSGESLEDYFQRHILRPLGMIDTSFLVPASKFARLAVSYQREPDGSLQAQPRVSPPAPDFFNGGGGLYSTAPDYTRFLQMLLRRGTAEDGIQILSERMIAEMMANQVGTLDAGRMRTTMPYRACDVDFHPGERDQFSLGFLINTVGYPNGRSAGSLAWAGIRNTFYWMDPARGICALLMMQFLPFCDPAAMSLLLTFETALYAELP